MVARIDIDVQQHGPVLDGRGPAVVADMVAEIEDRVAARALSEVQLILDQRIKEPTPYYETQVMLERMVDDVVVHDRNIVYGPWLEGISQRNMVTSFSGYAAFRTAAQRMNQRLAEPIIDRVVAEWLPRLGGV